MIPKYEPAQSRWRFVWTMPGGAVAIGIPAQDALDALARGGAIPGNVEGREGLRYWLGQMGVTAAGYRRLCETGLPAAMAIEFEAWKILIDETWQADRAPEQRYALAMMYCRALHIGGLNERAALEVIAAKDRPTGASALDIVDVSEIPTDRSRRNEWRRSTNGGPIIVPEDIAA